MLAWVLLGAALLFGGVYLWSAVILTAIISFVGLVARFQLAARGWQRTLDSSLAALLAFVLLQMLPLPVSIVRAVSPNHEAFVAATALEPPADAPFVPLTLDSSSTGHAALSLVCIVLTFWTARSIFARGGIRTFSGIIAWGAIALALVAYAQYASGTPLVYGFWRPRDIGARPLGPFINRNHFGTWAIMALCLCAGYLRWRSEGSHAAASWRSWIARSMDGRNFVLLLAVVLLAVIVAVGASRSSLVALGCGAGYVALIGSRGSSRRGGWVSMALVAGCAVVAMLGYGDGRQLLQRMDETRTVGMANRLAIWRDAIPLVRDFPVTGAGAGAFASAMRVYQTTPRTYYHNEAHNQYLQVAAEGGLLLGVPAGVALIALIASGRKQLGRREDPVRAMRLAAAGALIGVAVQSIWETGLTVPANGMFAATLAALMVHGPEPGARGFVPEQETR